MNAKSAVYPKFRKREGLFSSKVQESALNQEDKHLSLSSLSLELSHTWFSFCDSARLRIIITKSVLNTDYYRQICLILKIACVIINTVIIPISELRKLR